MNKSNITWTETTWSPVIGCTKVSAGCKHCYAEREVKIRWDKNPKSIWYGRDFNDVLCRPEVLAGASSPLKWKKARRIFVCPRADLFHEAVPVEFIDKVFAVMTLSPQHTFQVLTKRAERMSQYMNNPIRLERIMAARAAMAVTGSDPAGFEGRPWSFPLQNVWLGVSIENQETADERIPLLRQTPAAVRWISAEPLLGPVDLGRVPRGGTGMEGNVDWVVAGGESGPQARPMHPAWPRALRDQCAAAGVPFLFKQWGEFAPMQRGDDWGSGDTVIRGGIRHTGRLLDGVLHDTYPEVAR